MEKNNFEIRRKHLEGLSNDELKARFWELAGNIVEPLLETGRRNTTPSIERSVLLRMGFSSVEAKNIADKCADNGLLGKGAGHTVYKLSEMKGISIREAGLALEKGLYWDEVSEAFGEGGGESES